MGSASRKVGAALLVLTVFVPGASGDCKQFFVKRQVAYVQQGYVAPVYAAPIIYTAPQYYAAGQDLQQRAQIIKEVRSALREELALIQQQAHQGLQLRQQQTEAPPLARPQFASVFQRCIKCHSGPDPEAGLTLDGTKPITCHHHFRWCQIAGPGKNVPTKMAFVHSMSPEEKGAIEEALLEMVEPDLIRADTLPTPLPPPPLPPRPVPNDGLE